MLDSSRNLPENGDNRYPENGCAREENVDAKSENGSKGPENFRYVRSIRFSNLPLMGKFCPCVILSATDGEWTVHDTDTTDAFSSVWGFSSRDVFAGTHSGQLYHYNGSTWVCIEWNDGIDPGGCNGDHLELWGASDQTLFIHDGTRLVRLQGNRTDVLGEWFSTYSGGLCVDGLFIRSMWGSSPTDIFLVVTGGEEGPHLCEEYLLWWDGTEFHWF